MNKKTIAVIAVILGSIALIGGGIAFAYFGISVGGTGNTENNETEVTMVSLGAIYYTGETIFESTDMYPGDIGIQTFKIGPEEQDGIGTYEIDLEGVLPSEFNTDVEITLYKTTAPDVNYVSVNDGTLSTNNSEISRADELVVTGSPEIVYGPVSLSEEAITILEQVPFDTEIMEETTYYLVYNYKNNGDQNSQQGLTFGGKVTVRLIVGPATLTEKILVDGELANNYPSKDTWATFESVKCSYGTEATWDEENWTMVYPENVGDLCIVSFKSNIESGKSYLANLAQTDTVNLNTDDSDGNVRYMGKNPNNYVEFNDELWRIIGVFEVKNATTGVTESRVKIIRDESIGAYSWDSSASTINGGHGINEWSQADVMTLLNSGAYWNRTTGNCYNGGNNTTTPCDFSSTGLTNESKLLIDDVVVWNTGTSNIDGVTNFGSETSIQMYNFERSANHGKICSYNAAHCNDTVTRTTTWEGIVGLMYPSDYGLATSGGSTTNRAACLNTGMVSLKDFSDCFNNSWMLSNVDVWTMTPTPYSTYAFDVYRILPDGRLYLNNAHYPYAIHPTVYLNTDVNFVGGDGSTATPYQLSL